MQRPSGPRQRPDGPQQGPAGLLIASLRSWRKEEARLGTITANQRRRLAIGLLLLTPILALQLQRRAHGIGERLQQSHDDTVAIMESGLAVSLRAARDWGHWDDAYRYMRGDNPGYPVNNLGTAALFDGGAVMVLLEGDGQARLAFTSPAFRNVSYGGLIRCLQANRQRLTRVSSTMRDRKSTRLNSSHSSVSRMPSSA